jgi:DNA-binding CsgD family transcriptional regulator
MKGDAEQHERSATGVLLGAPVDEPGAVLAGVQGDLLDVLREVIDDAQNGELDLTPVGGGGLATVAARGAVRLTLIIEVTDATYGLSPRELQIARMVAGGATNHAIARSLDISPWTVSTHLRRIFAKLGVCTRAEMVAHLFGTPHLLAPE